MIRLTTIKTQNVRHKPVPAHSRTATADAALSAVLSPPSPALKQDCAQQSGRHQLLRGGVSRPPLYRIYVRVKATLYNINLTACSYISLSSINVRKLAT
jgi:hypothetical protein